MLHLKCLRCNRPLKNPAAQMQGYGAVCMKKIEAERGGKESNRATGVYLETEASNPDVVLRRDSGVQGLVATNVQKYVVEHSPTGFEWGYGGSGPADLALNILIRAGLPVDEARRLHQDFKWQFIAPMPAEGGIIPAATINKWIADNRTQPELAL